MTTKLYGKPAGFGKYFKLMTILRYKYLYSNNNIKDRVLS